MSKTTKCLSEYLKSVAGDLGIIIPRSVPWKRFFYLIFALLNLKIRQGFGTVFILPEGNKKGVKIMISRKFCGIKNPYQIYLHSKYANKF